MAGLQKNQLYTPDGIPIEPTFKQRVSAAFSDVATKGLINFADMAYTDRSKMSAAHKIYLDTFGAKGERGPVTKDYYNPEELNALSDLIRRKGGGKGFITYDDYGTLMKDYKFKRYPVISGRLDPYISISKSLGQFNYQKDPKTNTYRVVDAYDFNPIIDIQGREIASDFIGDYVGDNLFSPYRLARIYAGRQMPPGTGRKVDLAVPVGGVPVAPAQVPMGEESLWKKARGAVERAFSK